MKMVNTIFVYGSLRSGFQSEAYQYISQYFYLLGNAKVKGMLYDMGRYPVAVATENDCFIIGELYKIINDEQLNWALEQLDDYEGLNVEAHENALYKRELATVFMGYETVQAWVYWFTGLVEGKPIIANGDMLKYMQQKK